MADFFTADWHLNHLKIIEYCNRPFKSTDEMNDTLIQNTNKLVGPNDRLYFLGDFLFGPLDIDKFLRTAAWFRRRLKCNNIFLLYGNHDRRGRRYEEFNELFSNAQDYMEIKSEEQSIILNHYPISPNQWNRVNDGAWHLHGHSHGNIPLHLGKGDNYCARLDVGIDCYYKYFATSTGEPPAAKHYRPFSFQEVKNVLNGEGWLGPALLPPDHIEV